MAEIIATDERTGQNFGKATVDGNRVTTTLPSGQEVVGFQGIFAQGAYRAAETYILDNPEDTETNIFELIRKTPQKILQTWPVSWRDIRYQVILPEDRFRELLQYARKYS